MSDLPEHDVLARTRESLHRVAEHVLAAAALVGTEPGFPTTGETATRLEPDAPLVVDPGAARVIADWFALGAGALHRLSIELAHEGPSEVVLFPEHFDVGITAGAVNYGASPGDADIQLPYAYVGPHSGPASGDDFWNASFGAFRSLEEIGSADAALAFFLAGHERLAG